MLFFEFLKHKVYINSMSSKRIVGLTSVSLVIKKGREDRPDRHAQWKDDADLYKHCTTTRLLNETVL